MNRKERTVLITTKHDMLTEQFSHRVIKQAQLVIHEDVLLDFFNNRSDMQAEN